ncbi:MAG: peptidase M50 [Ruminococcus sp.]|nr:peptidase M50 [Ruminococcus sp.]
MISFDIFQTKIKIHFSFFAVIALISLWQNTIAYDLIMALICCMLHEAGHLLCMYLFSQSPNEIVLYGGGIKIKNSNEKLLSAGAETIILFAGCAVNILLCCISVLIFKKFTYFASANLFFGLFNLMPVKYFDGGRIISNVLNDSPACKLIRILFIIAFAIIIIVMIINGLFSISLILTFVYILISEFFT